MLKVATKEDIETIKSFYNKFLETTPSFKEFAIPQENLEEYANSFLNENDPNRMIVLSYEKDEPVGMIAFECEQDNFKVSSYGTRKMIWVNEKNRGHGHFQSLMGAFEDWAKSLKCNYTIADVLENGMKESLERAHSLLGYNPLDRLFIKRL